MAGYIKSHSNYRLQTLHQVVNDGIIVERDISTIGGVNSFATGQATVYQSGNFVMVVNNSSSASRHIRKKSWLASGDDSDVWTGDILKTHTSDVNGSVESKIMLKNDFMDFRSFAYYGSLNGLIENTISKIITTFPYELYISKENFGFTRSDGTIFELPQGVDSVYEVSNPGSIDIHNISHITNQENRKLGHFFDGGVENYAIYVDSESTPLNGYGFTWNVEPNEYATCPTPGKLFSTIQIQPSFAQEPFTILAFWDSDRLVRYFVVDDNAFVTCHIRPKEGLPFYEDFIDDLDLFGKCLMGYYSGSKNTARFEVLSEGERGINRKIESFTFPSERGDYNIATDGFLLENYIKRLGRIGLEYDELYTDNLYRLMTHDSLKNLDWTKDFNGVNDDDESVYVKSGQKFASVIRVMGYVFDNEKTYIDSIGNINTITYSNRSNLSDYFMTDTLETDGWVVNSIYPYKLTEYDKYGNEYISPLWISDEQIENKYIRKFSEDTSLIIKPYERETSFTGYYTTCENGKPIDVPIIGYEGQSYINVDGKTLNILIDYFSEKEMTLHDVNNEFMKRLRINSRNILRKKGTIESIESILSLFGMKSKRWCQAHNHSYSGLSPYDFEVEEYTAFAAPIQDPFDNVHKMYKIDWYNSCKTVPYQTQSYLNGEYIPYQGLPVAYRDTNHGRLLYPNFAGNGIYDGGMYYQMNGGWMKYRPYRFDNSNNIFTGNALGYDVDDITVDNYLETLRNTMFVNNIPELLSQPTSDLFDNVIYYVTNIDDNFAIINGYPYPLKEEAGVNGEVNYYFEVEVYTSSVSIGGDLYTGMLNISGPNPDAQDPSSKEILTYDLDLYDDGYTIRIYYTGDRNDSFTIYANVDEESEITPVSSYVFLNGCYDTSYTDYTHYFKLVDLNSNDKLGEEGWKQIRSSEEIYQAIEDTVDNYLGNNPHSGGVKYDDGNEYLNRFRQLFKYAFENRYFDESCFPSITDAYNQIKTYGFDVLKNVKIDSKVHAFVDRIDVNGAVTPYDIDNKSSLSGITDYQFVNKIENADGVTSQIINTKQIRLVFYVDNFYQKADQERIKYIQSKVIPYVEQVIPSTSIVTVKFKRYQDTDERLFDPTFDYTFN